MTPRDTSLILFSHGSLLCGAGRALAGHAERLRERGDFAAVEAGYLNYSEPTFAEAVRRCADVGVEAIIVAPYFLAPGYFVTTSLPRVIAAVQPDHPALRFTIAAPLGAAQPFADALIDAARRPLPRDAWGNGLIVPADACRDIEACPARDAGGCPRHPGHSPLTRVAQTGAAPSAAVAHPSAPSFSPAANSAQPDTSAHPPLSETALLVVAHGSPDSSANEPMLRVLADVESRGIFHSVTAGFLECNEPDIPAAAGAAAESGARRVIVAPYFLHTGKHVASDLPRLIEAAQARHGSVEFALTDYLGASPRITEVLAERAIATLPGGEDAWNTHR
jgi:sirohydrochlorin cobaltochelatase